MPELPEIAVFKKYLDATSLHQKITQVEFPDSGVLQVPQGDLKKALKGHSLEESTRLGKYLMVRLSGGSCLVFHFGMTGTLEYYKNQDTPKYSKMIIHFENDYHLAYTNRRKLGKIYLEGNCGDFQESHSLGKDALELSEKEFLNLLKGKKTIKGVLMDQSLLSGIGNVYSDEMLFQSKIHPKTKSDQLTEKQQKQLYNHMVDVLKMAIEKEGERSEFPPGYLSPHRTEGEACPRCSGKIKKIKVSGRSTYFCPSCQKEGH